MDILNAQGPPALLALSISGLLDSAGSLLMVALGLGFVIFLHELGHFLVAKWAGVHVKTFSIGFPPTLVSWRKGLGFRVGSSAKEYEGLLKAEREGMQGREVHKMGETEYVFSWIPLGGYVSMVGEDPKDAEGATDPRAFANKPVPSRMAIISAGVTMNLILGLCCFIASYKLGMNETPALVGHVVPGMPAYDAGLRVGDEIVAIDGRKNPSFKTFMMRVALSGKGDIVHLDMKRPGVAEPFRVDLTPLRREKDTMPRVGLAPASSNELSPAPYRAPLGVGKGKAEGAEGLKEGDLVVKVGPEGGDLRAIREPEPGDSSPILERDRIEEATRSRPITVEVRRVDKEKGGPAATEIRKATIPPNRFLDLGVILAFGPIESIARHSPAEAAGFLKGDTITRVAGLDPLDPMRLPDFCRAHAGEEITVEVARTEANLTTTKVLKVTPDDTPPWHSGSFSDKLLAAPGLGLAFAFSTRIAGARSGLARRGEGPGRRHPGSGPAPPARAPAGAEPARPPPGAHARARDHLVLDGGRAHSEAELARSDPRVHAPIAPKAVADDTFRWPVAFNDFQRGRGPTP